MEVNVDVQCRRSSSSKGFGIKPHGLSCGYDFSCWTFGTAANVSLLDGRRSCQCTRDPKAVQSDGAKHAVHDVGGC